MQTQTSLDGSQKLQPVERYDELQWEDTTHVGGVDFGSQILQRFYSVEKVPTGSCSPHFLFYRPRLSAASFESLKPLLRLGKSLIKWKYVIFLFNNEELRSMAAATWPEKVQVSDIRKILLKSLEECEVQRVKIRKEGMSVYLYAVKERHEKFVMQDLWQRLQQHVQQKGDIF